MEIEATCRFIKRLPGDHVNISTADSIRRMRNKKCYVLTCDLVSKLKELINARNITIALPETMFISSNFGIELDAFYK